MIIVHTLEYSIAAIIALIALMICVGIVQLTIDCLVNQKKANSNLNDVLRPKATPPAHVPEQHSDAYDLKKLGEFRDL